MRRSRKVIGERKSTIAFVVEGQTEMWYLQMLKKNEEKDRSVRINIKPEIPQKSDLANQYELVRSLAEEHKVVFWILDFDVILKNTRENRKNVESSLDKFLKYRRELQKKKFKNVKIIVNNPCFEYWFLLHYVETQRGYQNCSEVIRELQKKMSGYQKTEKYFKNKKSDIYARLKPNLKKAIENTKLFDGFDAANPEKSMCEMDALFMIDELKHCRYEE